MKEDEALEREYNRGYTRAMQELECRVKSAYQDGYNKGLQEGAKIGYDAMVNYEMTVIRPLLIKKDK